MSAKIAAAVSFGLMFTLFFAFDLPHEIRESAYTPSVCKIETYHTRTKYHCAVEQCQCRESWAPVCSSVISFLEHTYDPDDTSVSPGTPACSNGYKCCQTSCSTCTRCYDLHGENCYTYDCDCYCSRYVNNRACAVGCEIYRTADMVVLLAHSNVSSRVLVPFKADADASSAHAIRFPAGEILTCYYNKNAEILFEKTYTSWKWTTWGLVGVFPLLMSIGFLVANQVAMHKSLYLV